MEENEKAINGQGIRLVKQEEGVKVPLLQPWEVEGEKELLKGTSIKALEIIERELRLMHEHNQICKNPTCGVTTCFEKVMKFRRKHMLPMLQDGQKAFYETTYALLTIFILSHGRENLYVSAVFEGLDISAELIKSVTSFKR